ncbi:MAG: hypothetical protein R6W73_02515 [Candidatus Saliniplasma sp.]
MTIIFYFVLILIFIFFLILFIRLYSKKGSEYNEGSKYSEVNGKISEVKTRLNTVKKKTPKGIKIDLSEYDER